MSKKSEKVIIGIDLGGTGIKIGIADTDYEILAQTSVPTRGERPFEQVIADMGHAALQLLEQSGYRMADCLGAGVGSPGTVDSANGVVLYSNNIRWSNVPLAAELGKYLPVTIYVNNDANCAALGETVKGAAKGYSNAVFLTLGTGVGGGVVINGRIFEGGHPGGVELGHIRIASEGRICTCGREDCLEAYASATALIEDAKTMAKRFPNSILWQLCGRDLDQMNAKMPFDAAQAGDPCGQALVERYIRYLADGITDLANIFRPDIIVLGGGICAQGATLTDPINRCLKENCFGAAVSYVPEVVIAQNGNDAGIIGAASLVGTARSGQAAQYGIPEKEVLFLEPVCTENIWGGSRLMQEFHYPSAKEQTGECWGISAHPNGDGTIKNGRFAGKHLSEVWQAHPQLFGSDGTGDFPLLAKIIDAREDLSIQVHPDDTYAREHENGANGKTECWYILDCEQPASLVIGHNAHTKEELSQMIKEDRWKELLREVPVKKGDFIPIEPGTVHAIKGGCLIFETQQNSDVTYRLYDYGRLSNGKPRELHLDKSMDVIKVPAKEAAGSICSVDGLPKNQMHQLLDCAYFTIFKIDVAGEVQLEQAYPFLAVSVLEGEGYVDEYPVKKGDHCILPAGYGRFCLKGNMMLMASTKKHM